MTIYIALLRGINVGGHKKILMADLKAMFQHLGFTDIITYIQSGNIIWKAPSGGAIPEIQSQIKAAIAETFKMDVPVIVRTYTDWQKIIQTNPFTEKYEIADLHLTLFSQPPSPESILAIRTKDDLQEEYTFSKQEVFLYCPNGYQQTSLSNNFWEKNLGLAATTRNWKTVLKLGELAEAQI